jgi:hypothetical protein
MRVPVGEGTETAPRNPALAKDPSRPAALSMTSQFKLF